MNIFFILRQTALKIARIFLIIAILYIGIVFYLALTERRIAFPRAVADTQARKYIEASRHTTQCKLRDGNILHGWDLHPNASHTLLYFPDQNEDAATFLAEMKNAEHIRLISFNYRGSGGDNSGTLNEKYAKTDTEDILQCAFNLSEALSLAGRGTGAIYAFNLGILPQINGIILIDPVSSIAEAISNKYRILFPNPFIKTSTSVQISSRHEQKQIFIIKDRVEKEIAVKKAEQTLNKLHILSISRGGRSFESTISLLPLFK